MKLKHLILAGLASLCLHINAAPVEVDKVVATVNDDVILDSEVKAIVRRVKEKASATGQTLPRDQVLRTQAKDRLIDQVLQMQLANRMGLQISDAQLDQTLVQIAKEQGGTIEDLRQTVEQSGDDFQAYREEIRTEMTTSQVMQANVSRRIYISLQEIDNLLKILEQQGASSSEEYLLGHILIALPDEPTTEDIEATRTRANKVIELLNSGRNFKQIAITSSSAENALEGGQLDWMNINEMPSLFAEAVRGKAKDTLVGPLRSGAGFHIVKVQDIRGRQVVEQVEVKSRHILIKPSIIVSEEKARDTLAGFAKDLRNGEADFAELAKEHSEDPGSALKGGEYDFADPNKYDKAFKDALLSLEKGEISEPFRSSFGWHIVQLLDKRVQDKTQDAQRNRAHGMLYNRKFKEEAFAWKKEIRDQAYIEYLED